MSEGRDNLQRESAVALIGRVLYGSYAWVVFVLIALGLLLLLLFVPNVQRRRHYAGIAARLVMRGSFHPLHVTGVEHLPQGQCVVAANHASYIDAIVVKAVLPERFAYVVKREMAAVPLAGLLLELLGTEFVERFNRHRGGLDARRVLRTVSGGQALLFFPEGTFVGEPGLLKFNNGAFKSAIAANCPSSNQPKYSPNSMVLGPKGPGLVNCASSNASTACCGPSFIASGHSSMSGLASSQIILNMTFSA